MKIFGYTEEIKCEMARQILDDEGIDSVVLNKKDRAYQFGEIELYVMRDNVIRAKRILKELTP